MFIRKPAIFEKYPNLVFGLSLKIKHQDYDEFNFNMSRSIGDIEKTVLNNRAQFFYKLGLTLNSVVIQKQTHSDTINVVDKFTDNLEGDALITKVNNLGLAISTADCTNIYLYDSKEKFIAAVHSGWEGTEKRILEKTMNSLVNDFKSHPKNIHAYFAPSISQKNYVVGKEFSNKFSKKYLLPINEKFLLDLKMANRDMLLKCDVPGAQIEISNTCSFGDQNYHSFRRDNIRSGRALGVIALKDSNESG